MPAIIRIAVKPGNEIDFFMAKFSCCECKSTVQKIYQEMESPDSMVLSPFHSFLSLNGFWKWVPLDDTMKSRRIEYGFSYQSRSLVLPASILNALPFILMKTLIELRFVTMLLSSVNFRFLKALI